MIRSYARAVFLRERADIDWTTVGAKVKDLLDKRIDATVRTLMAPVSILDADFEQKIERLPHDEARASLMEHALRAQIKENVAVNPAFYERLSEARYQVIRSPRRHKTIEITVDEPGLVTVAAPADTPAGDLEAAVRRRAGCVRSHSYSQRRQGGRGRAPPPVASADVRAAT